MKKALLFLLLLVVSLNLVSAATLKGTVYNTNLDPETNVLVKISTVPEQRFLSRDGNYLFVIAPGKYAITALKGTITTREEISLTDNGEYVFDLFLFPEGTEEDDLWNETEQNLIDEGTNADFWGSVGILGFMVVLFLIIIILYYYRRKKKKISPQEELLPEKELTPPEKLLSPEEQKQQSEALDKVLEIIKKHDGRITQKELRKEMLYLSEAKISLILTELEHQGKIEKIKKGRGNVIILK